MKSTEQIKLKICTVLLLLGTAISNGQAPNWTLNSNDFEYSMTLVAFLNIEGVNLESTDDTVAAFSNDEVRGVADLVYESQVDRYYAYLTIFSNQNNETISFKVYNSSSNQVIDITTTLSFEINGHIGNLFQSYSIANPQLNAEAEIVSIDLVDETVNSISNVNNTIIIYASEETDVNNVNLDFTLSDGAALFYEGTPVISSTNTFDLENPKSFIVRSQDESLTVDYSIQVITNNVGDSNFNYLKKDAVCYRGGAIKIVSNNNNNGIEVQLLENQQLLQTKNIIAGEVIFSNLSEGSYVVRSSGIDKVIIIELKE
jgi:hypothetical protein